MKSRTHYLLIICAVAGIVGCGDGRPTRVPVAGQVLIDDQPLKQGRVKFVSASGRPAVGELDSSGHFRLSCYEANDGAIPGSYKVSVTSAVGLSPVATRWFAPKKYADFRTSGITQEITAPTDNLVIKISWDGGHEFIEKEPGADDTGDKGSNEGIGAGRRGQR